MSVVIIGAGQAGFQTAASLREFGYQEEITLIGEEPELPYRRPPLSKAFLKESINEFALRLRPQQFFAQQRIELVTGVRVTKLDIAGARVELGNGSRLAYKHLVLATGARNRRLNIEGASLDGIFYLRDHAEAQALKQALEQAANVVVVGAGFIGLEVAAVARELGKAVTVLEAAPRVMSRTVSPITAAHFEKVHERAGIIIKRGVTPLRFHGRNGKVEEVESSAAERLPADVVVIGIGIEPDTELAAQAGLPIANGVVVDETLLTAAPAVSAIGDCAAFPDVIDRVSVRLESVQNATDHGRCVAAGIVKGRQRYSAVPWFWSDQGKTRLQIAGYHPSPDFDVVRGDPESAAFSVFRFRDGRLRVVESINATRDHMAARRLFERGAAISPQQAADPSFDLKA
jgi:3-phenylpropionate/trans-cinnamate dioxygenase ferredoxin reductase subunit